MTELKNAVDQTIEDIGNLVEQNDAAEAAETTASAAKTKFDEFLALVNNNIIKLESYISDAGDARDDVNENKASWIHRKKWDESKKLKEDTELDIAGANDALEAIELNLRS